MKLRNLTNQIIAHYLEILSVPLVVVGLILSFRQSQYLGFVGIALSIIALFISIRDGKYSREATTKANEEYKHALFLTEEYSKLVQEYKGQILD